MVPVLLFGVAVVDAVSFVAFAVVIVVAAAPAKVADAIVIADVVVVNHNELV